MSIGTLPKFGFVDLSTYGHIMQAIQAIGDLLNEAEGTVQSPLYPISASQAKELLKYLEGEAQRIEEGLYGS